MEKTKKCGVTTLDGIKKKRRKQKLIIPDTNPKDWVWDNWQQTVMAHNGNITLRCGRQCGKSEVISSKAVKFALENPGTTTLIIAASQRQSSLLFEKVKSKLAWMEENENTNFFAEPPTQTKAILTNGSKIHSHPTGRTGYFIRGFTIDLLIADEAAYIPEGVWNAVVPMIAVSRKKRGMGWIILLSTPWGQEGYYYNSFDDPDFLSMHVTSEECSRIPKDFLEKEKARMPSAQYRQEYLAEFVDDTRQYFASNLIKACCTEEEEEKPERGARYYLGVDFARFGADESAYVIMKLLGTRLICCKIETTFKKSSTDDIGMVINYDTKYNFNRIFIDDGGLGSPIYDLLVERLGRKVVGLNNASQRFESQGEEKKKGILKQDLYQNLLLQMEQGKIKLLDNLLLKKSLKSITFEYTAEKRLKIFGLYSHLTEALVRACWCLKEKGHRIYCY